MTKSIYIRRIEEKSTKTGIPMKNLFDDNEIRYTAFRSGKFKTFTDSQWDSLKTGATVLIDFNEKEAEYNGHKYIQRLIQDIKDVGYTPTATVAPAQEDSKDARIARMNALGHAIVTAKSLTGPQPTAQDVINEAETYVEYIMKGTVRKSLGSQVDADNVPLPEEPTINMDEIPFN